MNSELKSENTQQEGGCSAATCSGRSDAFKRIIADFRDFRYGDAVAELGAERVESLLMDGYVAVPWAEHAEMFRLRCPDIVRGLDRSGETFDRPIWNCHALHDELGPLVASPTAQSLRAAREYLRERPAASENDRVELPCGDDLSLGERNSQQGIGS